MFDLFKIIITFLLTGCVGVFISHHFQRKNVNTQLVFKKAERKAIELKETRDKFEDLASDRIYRTKLIITSLMENTVTDKERDAYQESVVNWNKKLNSIYFDLNSQKLYGTANALERDVHNEFFSAHKEIKKAINRTTIPNGADLNAALSAINRAAEESKAITQRITTIADSRWDEIKNADSIALSYQNLEQASTLTLLRALFHSSPHRLRINRSRFDS